MAGQNAYKVLGIAPGADRKEIKKRYRQLMQQVHPDTAANKREPYAYSVQEINNAYAALMKESPSASSGSSPRRSTRARQKKQKNMAWDAPLNAAAYSEREILQYVEDEDGAKIGSFCVAKGKYLWKTEEEFPLFLLSLYRCGKELLDEVDDKLRRREDMLLRQQIQPELTYLLAQQFINGTELLPELAAKEQSPDGTDIYYISSMLEWTGRKTPLPEDLALYPSRLEDHRLYLQNDARKELGYLSFADDRLYYILIPLLEQKRVQVKINAAEKTIRYQKLHLRIRFLQTDVTGMPENLSLQIEQLLAQYGTS